jgi:lipoprotein-anchoring transpeptidase ErfK/SrfK
MKVLYPVLFFSLCAVVFSCKEKPVAVVKEPEPVVVIKKEPVIEKMPASFTLLGGRDTIKKFIKNADSAQLAILFAVNRVDRKALANLDTIVVPADMNKSIASYMPFPERVGFLDSVKQLIFFSYPAQVFAAYEYGKLVRTGPTSMGRKNKPTPTGLFFTNWKAKESISTVNDEWKLKWNFNIQNNMGVGFHEYALPGYPASHSCLRLISYDAEFLYNWAQQWVLDGSDKLIAHGTPVIVFGSYPFGKPRPWRAVAQNPAVLNISENDLQGIAEKYLADILAKQKERTNTD